jgi:hypothetical protein
VANIDSIIVPDGLNPDFIYDKFGNEYIEEDNKYILFKRVGIFNFKNYSSCIIIDDNYFLVEKHEVVEKHEDK